MFRKKTEVCGLRYRLDGYVESEKMEMYMQNEMREERNMEKEVNKVEEAEWKAGMYIADLR